MKLNRKEILLGYASESMFINLLILIARNYIYQCKPNEKMTNMVGITCKIKYYHLLEGYITKTNNEVQLYEKYWTPLYTIFP